MKKLSRIIFGRTFFLILALLLQTGVLLLFMVEFSSFFFVYYGFTTVVSVLMCAHVANLDMNPNMRMSWITVIMAMPIFGVLFYIFVRIQPQKGKINKRLSYIIEQTKPFLRQKDIVKEESDMAGFAAYMNNYAGYPIYNNSDVKYFALGEEKYEELIKQLKLAKNFIFLEYFIIDEGKMWNTILDILKEKVKEGVEVRLMYDGTCMFALLPHSYPKQMEKYGIKCCVFSPIRPALAMYQNNRDHRKILVIDGKVAFTGGVNLADEYINEISKFGHWKDNAVMITGEAVRSFTMMFLQVWNIQNTIPENYEKYLLETSLDNKNAYVMPYGDQPFDKENVGEYVYMDIINKAKKYVYIMTPYLILDNEMLTCLEQASKRGVDIKIMMPHKTDKPSAYFVARTYYSKLIDRGIEIYEYTPGFVHAKTFVSDDKRAVVGTINMDFRSLYLNFECAAYMENVSAVSDIYDDYKKTLEKCVQITKEECEKYNPIFKLIGKLLWIIAPLM